MSRGFSIQDWYYKLGKGKLRSYVAREEEPLSKVAKTVKTLRETGHITSGQVERMVQEVFNESVQPFLGPPYRQPERQKRFDDLKDALGLLR
ncbi:MAG: hypothetical protein ACE5I9_04805 [Candidatus Methylomirabilales bacterium]